MQSAQARSWPLALPLLPSPLPLLLDFGVPLGTHQLDLGVEFPELGLCVVVLEVPEPSMLHQILANLSGGMGHLSGGQGTYLALPLFRLPPLTVDPFVRYSHTKGATVRGFLFLFLFLCLFDPSPRLSEGVEAQRPHTAGSTVQVDSASRVGTGRH